MSTVRIPPTLRDDTGGAKQLDIAGATVGEVVQRLVADHPALGGRLLDASGEVNRFVNVFVNDTDIRHLAGLDTAVDERDRIVLLPAMAGG
jgi:molybdopterin synthase sulfur carrier subunit